MILALLTAEESFSFQFPLTRTTHPIAIVVVASPAAPSASTALWAKARKAKQTKKAERTRPQQFYDAIDEARGKTSASSSSSSTKTPSESSSSTAATVAPTQQDLDREARKEDALRRMDERPDVSTIIVDDETGMEIVAQGKSVMDVVTRKAVKLSTLGPTYRLAQMFPGVPPDVRNRHRVDWNTIEIPELVERLRTACAVTSKDGTTRKIPPHPSLSNTGIDFVLANRDFMGRKMKQTLGRLQMRTMAQGNKPEALELQQLWKNFLTLENHISAPFRQMMMDAEGRVGPNFGNLDLKSYCKGEMYERAANYLVLKGMVAHWEKKVVDADRADKTPQTKSNYISVMSIGDPRRFLPDPPILFTLRECTQVCLMAQQMTKAFVEESELFDDLPPEIRFLEKALSIKGGAALRKFVIDDFCPAEGITPEGLREGLRRLLVQLENMQIDPYADISNILERLIIAMSVGTDDERDPYAPYLLSKDPNGPGAFPTYTFDHDKLSLVRFLDSQYERSGAAADAPSSSGLSGIFGFGGGAPTAQTSAVGVVKAQEGDTYKVPAVRAARRPHELGWLDLLKDEKEEQNRFGKVPPGRIIVEE